MAEPFAAGMRLLILTGARRSEIFEAERGELVPGAIRLPEERAKNEEGRIIPLSPPALAIVEALPVFADSPWLLDRRRQAPVLELRQRQGRARPAHPGGAGKARRRGEPMPPWRIHDLRRSVATGMQRLGVRLEVVEAVLGHMSGSRAGIVGVYQRHQFATEAREALALWGEHVMRLLDPTPAKVVPMRQKGA